MSHLEASAPIFKVHLIPYTLMIYLHIDMKAAFIIHAIINRKSTKKKNPSSTHRMQRSVFEMVAWC